MRFRPCAPIYYLTAAAPLIYIAPTTKLPSESQTLRLRWVNFYFCSDATARYTAEHQMGPSLVAWLRAEAPQDTIQVTLR